MTQAFRVPAPPLSAFVEVLWYQAGTSASAGLERTLPTGTVELVINLREDHNRIFDRRDPRHFASYRGALVCGAHAEFFVIETDPQEEVLGVHFRPGGAWPFLGLPVGELCNQHLSLEELWGGAAVARLYEELLAVSTPAARFQILERALLARAGSELRRHPAVAFALRELDAVPSPSPVAELASRAGYSQRRLAQLFRREVGLTPKLYGRVSRFQEVLRQLQGGGRSEWVEVALACGYYDQAHFNHDFRAFSGLSPSGYLKGLAGRDERVNHVPFPE